MVTTIVIVMRRTSTGTGGPTQVGIVHHSTGRHSVSIESMMYVWCRCGWTTDDDRGWTFVCCCV